MNAPVRLVSQNVVDLFSIIMCEDLHEYKFIEIEFG